MRSYRADYVEPEEKLLDTGAQKKHFYGEL